MKLPNLPINLPFGRKKQQPNYFLTLTIGGEKADAIIFEELLGRVKVIGHHFESFGKMIEQATDEEILNASDKAITTAEKNLPENIQTQKTVFGVDPSWVEGGKIKKEYLLKLKKISEELELIPVGFIVTTEAICHLLTKEEGAPLSAILVQVGKDYLTATLVRAGRIIESKTSDLNESTPSTLDTLLKHLTTAEVLPSRIIVFGENSEKSNQDFVSYSWSKSLPFLHLPQITSLEDSFDAKSVLYGAANQMGFNISDISMFRKSPQVIDEMSDFNIDEESSGEEEVGSSGPTKQYFGFVEGSDVSQKASKESKQLPDKNFKQGVEEIPEELKINQAEKRSLPVNALLIVLGLKSILAKLAKNLKNPQKLSLSITNRGGKFFFIPMALFGLLLLLIFYFLFFRAATISIDVLAKSAAKNQDVVFSTDKATSVDSSTIKSDFLSVSEDGKLTTLATGKKQTGDKAKGTVTIFNLSPGGITLESGTKIISSNNLDFTLDKSISVASPSGDATSPTPGKTDVPATALTFGTSYNLPSGTKFTVGSYSTSVVAGKNDSAFSGGTTKDITVVSKEDLDKLTADIVKNLEDKAKADLQKKVSGGSVALPNFISAGFDLKSFSKNVGDEAKDVSITATISYQFMTYSKDDLISFSQKLFSQDTKAGNLTINSSDTSVEVTDILKKDNKNVSGKITIKTKILPKLDKVAIADSAKGKSFETAKKLLLKTSQVENVFISFSPNLFFFPKILPNSSGKIKVIVNVNE